MLTHVYRLRRLADIKPGERQGDFYAYCGLCGAEVEYVGHPPTTALLWCGCQPGDRPPPSVFATKEGS